MQPASHTCSLLYKGSMHACMHANNRSMCCVACIIIIISIIYQHHIMIDDMMMTLHIESNSKLHNKSKVSTLRLCIWSKEEETLCIWAPFASSSSSYLYFRFVCSVLVSVVSLLFLNSLSLLSRFFAWVCGVFVSFFSFLLGIEFC